MSGRLESAIKTQKNSERLLQELPDYVTDYYNNISAARESKTCREYVRKIRAFLMWATDDPKNYLATEITESVLARYMQSITIKKVGDGYEETSFSYRKTVWAALNGLCTYLYKRRIIPNNPMDLLTRPNNFDSINKKLLTEDDLTAIMQRVEEQNKDGLLRGRKGAAYRRDKAILLLFMNTGMRETALSEIDIDDVDMIARTLRVIDKRHKERTYYLNEVTYNALADWMLSRIYYVSLDATKSTRALFLTYDGNRIQVKGVAEIVQKYSERALGYKLNPHALRAAFCSILYDKTKDIEFVRDAVGHSSTSVTQRYIVKKESAQKQAAEMLENIFTA